MKLGEPTIKFADKESSWKEVNDFLKRTGAGSAPGPNGIPYKVYKQCERLRRRLWKLLKAVWRRNRLPDDWLIAEGCFIPKEENSLSMKQFHTISFLNVEGKIFLEYWRADSTPFC